MADAVNVLPWSVDLDSQTAGTGAGVMFELWVIHATYTLHLSSTVSDGLLPPKLAAWSGCAALEPAGAAGGGGVPGSVVVVLRASARFWGWAHAGAETSTESENVLPPSVETATCGSRGCRLGATDVRNSDRQAT